MLLWLEGPSASGCYQHLVQRCLLGREIIICLKLHGRPVLSNKMVLSPIRPSLSVSMAYKNL